MKSFSALCVLHSWFYFMGFSFCVREREWTWMAAKPNNPDMLAFPFPPSEREETAAAIRAINCYCIEQIQTDTHTAYYC